MHIGPNALLLLSSYIASSYAGLGRIKKLIGIVQFISEFELKDFDQAESEFELNDFE